MSSTNLIDAEDYEENPERFGEEVKDGFQDTSGSYPLTNYWNQPDVNERARGNVSATKTNTGTRTARNASNQSQAVKNSVSEPDTTNQSQYPFNKVTETRSGHIIEIDDTPGHERLFVKHRTGSKIEFLPNGSIVLIGQNNRYAAIAGDEDLVIRGNCNVIIESDAAIRVQGDMTCQVDGDYNLLVQGDMTTEVQGDLTERVHGNTVRTFTGTYLRDIRGSVTERNLSNYLCWNTGTWDVNIGGASKLTTESTLDIISDDKLTMECEGGFIDLKTTDSYIVSGTSYAVNYHAENSVFAATNVHASSMFASSFDGNLEGTATRATFANTAGSAPMGSSSPTSPSPTSPTDPTASPDSNLEAVSIAEQSDQFIVEIDRSSLNNDKNKRILNTGEATSKMRNASLRYDSTWMQDLVNSKAILQTATSSNAPSVRRNSGSSISKIGNALSKIGNLVVQNRGFTLTQENNLKITSIPEKFPLTSNVTRGTKLSPNFTVAHFLAGDSDGAQFIDQGSLSKLDIAKNLQLLSFNVMEYIRKKYQDNYTISEGLYNLLPNESLASDSINVKFLQGLAVGLQFPDFDNSFYYDTASWAATNLVYDKIILSYIDYDPDQINEPTLIISINNGINLRELSTEFNHEQTANELQDLSG